MKKRILYLLILSISSISLTACGGKTEEIKNVVQEQLSQTSATITQEAVEEIGSIQIDGNIQKETTSVSDIPKIEDSEATTLTDINKRILLNIQENQNNYAITSTVTYKGNFNADIQNSKTPIEASPFQHNWTIKYVKGTNGNMSLIGEGNFYSEGGDVNNDIDYRIERYSNQKKVFLKKDVNNEKRWTSTNYDTNTMPQFSIDRVLFEKYLNNSTFSNEPGNYYHYTVSCTFEEMLSTFPTENIRGLFKTDILDKNITYTIKINKETFLPEELVMRKSFNDVVTTINHKSIYSLSPNNIALEGNMKTTNISSIEIMIDFDYGANFEIYIDDAIEWESKNGLLSNNFEYKTDLTKYDFKYLYTNPDTVLATFDSSSDTCFTCTGNVGGLSTEFYYTKIGDTNKRYLGKLEVTGKERFEKLYGIDIESLERVDNPYGDIYPYKYKNILNYYIKINDNYGFIYSNNGNDAIYDYLDMFMPFIKF